METAIMWVLGAIGAYFIGVFLLATLVIGCGFYFVWKLTKG